MINLHETLCFCRWCRPGWRTSKRDVRLHIADRYEYGPPSARKKAVIPLFLRRETSR